jgi:kinetochore protein Spc24
MRDMTPIIDPEEDYLTILAAEEQIATTEARRKKELEDTQLKLKGMFALNGVLFGHLLRLCRKF